MSYGSDSRGEWIKFGILSMIFLGTILVIWLLAPSIFARVVPAILGNPGNQPTSVYLPSTNKEAPSKARNQETHESDTPIIPKEDEVHDGNSETAPISAESAIDDTALPTPQPEAETTAPELVPRIHFVQPGENLTRISEQYGVSIEAIMQVNQLTNPDRIEAGYELLIPVRP